MHTHATSNIHKHAYTNIMFHIVIYNKASILYNECSEILLHGLYLRVFPSMHPRLVSLPRLVRCPQLVFGVFSLCVPFSLLVSPARVPRETITSQDCAEHGFLRSASCCPALERALLCYTHTHAHTYK